MNVFRRIWESLKTKHRQQQPEPLRQEPHLEEKEDEETEEDENTEEIDTVYGDEDDARA
jgi:hypothetical protein